ncbi:MAG: DMT family transporter [Rhodospirillales bacterium]|nr:DMT family transporter [Rhodospirillales bacterium]
MSPALQGALWMVATVAFSAANVVCIRIAVADVHPFVAAFFRNALALVMLLPWLLASGTFRLPVQALPLHAVRAGFGLTGMLLFFTAVHLTTMAETTALTQTAPLFGVLGAVVVLKERASLRRWAGVLVGFAGALLILRPGFEDVSLGALAALAAAVFMAADWITLKPLARIDTTRVVVTWLTVLMTPLSLAAALFVWQTPALATMPWLFALAMTATLGQATAVRAFAMMDVSYLALFDFLRLVFVAAIGFVAFGEILDMWTAAGAAIIVAAGSFAVRQGTAVATPPPAKLQ